jgi:hypothetical protein
MSLKPISRADAMELAMQILSEKKLKFSKAHINRILRDKTEDGTRLRWFWSVPVRTGGGDGLMIVDRDGTFGDMLMTALDQCPPTRRQGNVPVVSEENLLAPGAH